MTIPNLLSIFRIFLIPIFVPVFIITEGEGFSWWPVIILAVSGLTDLLDGFIARRYNQISDLGIILDPVADKLTQIAVCACLTVRYNQLLILLIIYVVKELVMLTGGAIQLKFGGPIPSAKWYGKLSTFQLYVAMGLFLIIPDMNPILINIIIVITIILVLFALVMYMSIFFNLLNIKGKTNDL